MSANKVTTGTLRGINVNASSHTTKGGYLTAAVDPGSTLTTPATPGISGLSLVNTSTFPSSGSGYIIPYGTQIIDAISWTGKTSSLLTGVAGVNNNCPTGSLVMWDGLTLSVNSTDDFPASGSGWIIDSLNDRNAFTYTGKAGTTLTGCSGVLAHNAGATISPAVKGMVIDAATNEMRFFGDRGDGTIEELAAIGINPYGGDTVIGSFGSDLSGNGRIAVVGRSNSNMAIAGVSYSASGIYGYSATGPAGFFWGDGQGPIRLAPSVSASAPTHTAGKGTLWVTSEGVLYINTNNSTAWAKVGAQ